ncbi:MAG: BLUF domain-containing protein [Erythrobacter sp.]|uniref:BLUF domain-containing protein n=1 Tax=Erythrobacter sp. TaxID=1042 RepID=UPI0026372EC5|nr:BLUF domain-containing protein [Erythrobacter sp.]MDJ0979538.1 BLUF domain-containing protein [Erythrobacter sp.]
MLLHDDNGPTGAGMIGCLTYQSRAASPPSDADLDELVTRARARNNRHGVTGMLLYENGRYLQTLEGPPTGLDTIWSSIRQDERHAEIEVLTQHLVSGRLFSDWDLLLYRKLDQAPKSLLEKLRRKNPLAQHVPAIVQYALEADEPKLNDLFARLNEKGWSGDALVRELLEPAARMMGDAWLADECSEFDLTLGLGMLQMAGHAVRYSKDADDLRDSRYTILLASAPGEPHLFGPSLLADQFTDAGWGVEMAFPTSNEALTNQINEQQPDAVDIALSDALPRQNKVSKLRETVRQSRWSLPDQPLVVSVGGRLFAEASATAEQVGADLARQSAAGTRVTMGELVENARRAQEKTQS